jgi:7,8-dihydropterin-6-yl-methyl-4-(beta-D-ribofuranosyl)aminobenzene 5'-phosphate synthase
MEVGALRIVSLLENTAARADVLAEHGLSLYIEACGKRILFDMGQSDLFARNAEVLGVDLSGVDVAILSHGHYDHGGGLVSFLELNKRAPVYLSEHAFGDYYNGTEKYIGLDKRLQGNPRLHPVADTLEIAKGLTLFSCNACPRPHGTDSGGLTKRVGDAFFADDFLHEQYLLVEQGNKRVLISGCSHKGILNIAEWFAPDVLIGGFHFSKMPLDGALSKKAQLLAAKPTQYFTCHCTGVPQFEFMRQFMPHLAYLACGEEIGI